MRFNCPRETVMTAMIPESKTPLLGLFETPEPFENGSRTLKILSLAMDCKIRGDPKKEAMADESVAAITPAVMSPGIRDTFFIAP